MIIENTDIIIISSKEFFYKVNNKQWQTGQHNNDISTMNKIYSTINKENNFMKRHLIKKNLICILLPSVKFFKENIIRDKHYYHKVSIANFFPLIVGFINSNMCSQPYISVLNFDNRIETSFCFEGLELLTDIIYYPIENKFNEFIEKCKDLSNISLKNVTDLTVFKQDIINKLNTSWKTKGNNKILLCCNDFLNTNNSIFINQIQSDVVCNMSEIEKPIYSILNN